MEFRIGPARVRFAPRGFHSGPRTPEPRSLLYGKGSGSRHCRASLAMPTPSWRGCRAPTCTCTERFGSSHRVRHARRNACGCSRSSYPAGSPRTPRFSRGCPYRATDARPVARAGGIAGRADRARHQPVLEGRDAGRRCDERIKTAGDAGGGIRAGKLLNLPPIVTGVIVLFAARHRRSMQSQKRQNCANHDDESDEIDNSIHCSAPSAFLSLPQ